MGKAHNLTPATKAVTYLRVSTQRQGASGLGLEAQRAAVETFCRGRGLEIIAEYVEIETGTAKRKRPQLAKAIQHSKDSGARLVIAKLDRLTRNLHFLTTLENSGVDFVAADMPDADKLVIHIMAAIAEKEAELISTRTRAALQALKARGVKLGMARRMCEERTEEELDNIVRMVTAAAELGRNAQRAAAVTAYAPELNYIRLLRTSGLTLRDIADQLNADGKRTRKSKPYTAMHVKRILDRAGIADAAAG